MNKLDQVGDTCRQPSHRIKRKLHRSSFANLTVPMVSVVITSDCDASFSNAMYCSEMNYLSADWTSVVLDVTFLLLAAVLIMCTAFDLG